MDKIFYFSDRLGLKTAEVYSEHYRQKKGSKVLNKPYSILVCARPCRDRDLSTHITHTLRPTRST